MSVPEKTMDAEILEFEQTPSGVEETDDGGAIVTLDEDEGPEEAYEFYDNIVGMFEDSDLQAIATNLMDAIDRDRKARDRRDKEYAEAIRRTGLGDEAPGGAEFPGASRVVHPMLTEASVDFSSRAVKELMPPNGPVRVYIPGENTSGPDRYRKAERKKNYMNWQFLTQMPEFRSELEQLLPQLSLSGSQYMRVTPDWSKNKTRPVPVFVPQDQISIPYSASNFYTAERQTYHEPITKMEFEARVRDGMYRDIGQLVSSQLPDETAAQKASEKVEGKEDTDVYNLDGVRVVHECSTWLDIEKDQYGVAPYLVSIDQPTRKIVAIVRNWEEDDEYFERMQWTVEFPFIPWRGAYSIGFGQMIGSLSGAATGALRALLDSAHVNNFPTLLKLKGANFVGQTKQELRSTQITEVDGGVSGSDIRQLLMPIPYNPPSPTLFQLLGFCVDAGRGVVRTTFDSLTEQKQNMPVGTTLALIEEGMQVFSAIHLRLYHAMTYVIRVIHRIDKMYLTDEEVKNDIGEVLARRSDFQGPLDVVPTADPQVFSDVQRLAQLQIVADRAAAMPDLYNRRVVEKRLLERTKIANPDELLIPEQKAEQMNQVNENVAMSLGQPVTAFPEQDHLAHIQILLDFMLSPQLGQLPVIAPTFLPAALEHLKEHVVLWYVSENYRLLTEAAETDEAGIRRIMEAQDEQSRAELDKTLAAGSPVMMERAGEVLGKLPDIVAQAMQFLQQHQQPPTLPLDPNAQAETARRAAKDAQDAQIKGAQLASREKTEFMKLSAREREDARRKAHEDARVAAERAARLDELTLQESAEDERTAAKLASDELRNTQDNATALKIAAAELESDGGRVGLKTGTGINP